jgi:hypothetical protein
MAQSQSAAAIRRGQVHDAAGGPLPAPPCQPLHLALDADVTVTGKESFVNLAAVERPEENLVGVALSASQGAVTARQIEQRPIMRAGEVLETVPGLRQSAQR